MRYLILATRGRRSKYSSEFKAKVGLEAIKEKETLAALAKRFDVSPSKITEWKDEFLKNASQAFEKPVDNKRELKKVEGEKERLLKKVGQLTLECDFFAKACEDAGLKVR
mgnify:FL=1